MFFQKILTKKINFQIRELHLLQKFKKNLRRANGFLKMWLPIITFTAVILPIFTTFVLLQIDQYQNDKSLKLAFMTENCLNLQNAGALKTGKSGEEYVFNVYYNTEFYRENWSDLYRIVEKNKLDPMSLYLIVQLMENANQMLKNNNFYPSNDLANTATGIVAHFKELHFILLEKGECLSNF